MSENKKKKKDGEKTFLLFCSVFFLLALGCIIFGVLLLAEWNGVGVSRFSIWSAVLTLSVWLGYVVTILLFAKGYGTFAKAMLSLYIFVLFCFIFIYVLQKIHGVGRADIMAQQRRLNPDILETLRRKKAVGEAFGDFFDFNGQTVWQAGTVSAALAHQNPHCKMVAVAAGEKKAEAIIASTRHDAHDTLITDEGAARRMIALLEEPLS